MYYTLTPVAFVRSPYTQKFGIPRQPHLVPSARVELVLEKCFGADSVRGLEDFDFVWIQFLFHAALHEGWTQTVRPPRLGGKRAGVFATRSPHRPNHTGLSLLKLDGIAVRGGRVVLACSGADLLDGTPVFDIKPYLPFVEAKPDAAGGFAAAPPPLLAVSWLPESGAERLPPSVRELVEQSLAQDPRPHYHHAAERIYHTQMAGWDIRFRIADGTVQIFAVQAANQVKNADT